MAEIIALPIQPYLTMKEIALILRCSMVTVRRFSAKGRLKGIEIKGTGHMKRYDPEKIKSRQLRGESILD